METLTISFIVGICVIIFIYDAYALSKSTNTEYTISYIIGSAARKNPIIPFMFGFLMGHFFFSQCFV